MTIMQSVISFIRPNNNLGEPIIQAGSFVRAFLPFLSSPAVLNFLMAEAHKKILEERAIIKHETGNPNPSLPIERILQIATNVIFEEQPRIIAMQNVQRVLDAMGPAEATIVSSIIKNFTPPLAEVFVLHFLPFLRLPAVLAFLIQETNKKISEERAIQQTAGRSPFVPTERILNIVDQVIREETPRAIVKAVVRGLLDVMKKAETNNDFAVGVREGYQVTQNAIAQLPDQADRAFFERQIAPAQAYL